MEWTTPVATQPIVPLLRTDEPVTLLGSCFAAEIGSRMESLRLPVCNNPFGVLYNPASIESSVRWLSDNNRLFTAEDVIHRDTGYNSFHHHGSFTAATPEAFLEQANRHLQIARAQFRDSTRIIVSLGTAWCYRHRERGLIVSNCHKIPAREFDRIFLNTDECAARLANAVRLSRQDGPKEWIFTVSPIRHRKDGLHENQLSKATLLLAVRSLEQELPGITYFPAYEILLDELRDYRFYAEDLVHPSAQAVRYIWERFTACAYSPEDRERLQQREKELKRGNHRPVAGSRPD